MDYLYGNILINKIYLSKNLFNILIKRNVIYNEIAIIIENIGNVIIVVFFEAIPKLLNLFIFLQYIKSGFINNIKHTTTI